MGRTVQTYIQVKKGQIVLTLHAPSTSIRHIDVNGVIYAYCESIASLLYDVEFNVHDNINPHERKYEKWIKCLRWHTWREMRHILLDCPNTKGGVKCNHVRQ